MTRYVRIAAFAEKSGYTVNAIRTKIRDGIWIEKRHWRRAPDGHIVIDVEGYEEWIENGSGLACEKSLTRQSKSPSPIRVSGVESQSKSPPPLKI